MNRIPVRLVRSWIVGLGVLLLAGPVWTQEDPQDRFLGEVEVTEVLLDVLVTDKSGQVIIGLGKDDFVIRENREAVEITGVTFYSSRELMGSKDALESHGLSVDETAEDRYFILFFQQQRRAAGDIPGLMGRQMDAGRTVEEWIAHDLQARDMVAVAVYDTSLVLVQDFTNNVEKLQIAVAAAVQGRAGKQDWPSREPQPTDGPSLLRNLPKGRELGLATTDIYRALQVLARSAGAVRGRKSLVFFGRGIGETNSFGMWEPGSRFWQATLQTLNDNNIAVYPLDVMPMGSRHSLEPSLDALANETGGIHHRQFTSFIAPLRRIAEENGGYYLLSYTTNRPSGESGYQKVKVTTLNPEIVVRARQGYLYGEDLPPN